MGHLRHRPRLRWLVGFVAAFALVAAACGGGGSGDGDDQGSGGDSAGVVDAADCPVKEVSSSTAPTNITVWHAYVGL